jgi:hypothetical protein
MANCCVTPSVTSNVVLSSMLPVSFYPSFIDPDPASDSTEN